MSILKLPDPIGQIHISSKGEITKQMFQGRFKVKRILSHSDKFEIKRIFRNLLGKAAVDKESEDFIKAGMLAEVQVRVLEGPSWFIESNYGLDLVDLSPITDLLTKCYEEEKNWRTDLQQTVEPEVAAKAEDEK